MGIRMSNGLGTILPKIMEKYSADLIDAWLKQQKSLLLAGQGEDIDQTEQSRRFIAALRQGVESGNATNLDAPAWAAAKGILEEFSRTKALKGSSPAQTATFVFSLKGPLFDLLGRELGTDAKRLAQEIWTATLLLDKLGLYTTEVHQKSREQIIGRQQEELLELSTPVVQLWDLVLALPLIGTLDSGRTQVVMENLLQEIVEKSAEIAIIDITGVPTVDTLVAQHLLKTVSAARLMGADCIISG